MTICTAFPHKKQDNSIEFINKMYHRVRVIADKDGNVAKKLLKIEKNCLENKKRFATGQSPVNVIFATVDGQLSQGLDGKPHIDVKEFDINFPSKMTYENNNVASIKGKIIETLANNGYATAIISARSYNGPIMVPVVISHKNNPKEWSDISYGKISKNDTIRIEGPLISRLYGNGTTQTYRCSINVKQMTILEKKIERKTSPTL
jgi:hypothetical protein